jgi:hypothetical protein
MVRQRMVRVRDANLRIGPHAALAPHHHRDDARLIGLKGDELQIEHQVDVVLVEHRNTGRLVDRRRQARHVLLGTLDSALDLADRRQVFVQLPPVGCAQIGGQLGRARGDEIEDAAAVAQAPFAGFRREARVDVTEQPLEHQPRVGLRRHGRRRPAPGQAVRVRARIPGITVADGA